MGGKSFIPSWLGIDAKDQKPYAEYWMGAHASAPAALCTKNGELSLHQLIKDYPEDILGKKVQQQFGELPYLLKILDVKDMLSIQVHPTRKGAEEGFLAEQAAGILPTASHRNYKDRNHKPEMMIALSEFWLLHGFLPEEKLKNRLENIPEFKRLREIFINKGIKGLFNFVMNIPQQEVNEILLPLIKRELERKKRKQLSKNDPGWWVCKLWNSKKDAEQDVDRGIFSIYFFNIVHLKTGEAIFQGPGIPHAYLEGQNVELMANSDNVLRGGLTDKHVDVPELMKHTRFEGITPEIIKGKNINANEVNFPCPVPDFGIHKILLNPETA